MRILLISSSYNGLCQRAHVELDNLGHDISITLALSADDVRRAVALFQPNLILCPFLKEKIQRTCIKSINASFFIQALRVTVARLHWTGQS